MSFEVLAIIFAIVVWIISGIIKGLKWLGKQLGGTNARPTLVQEALADAQRQAAQKGRPPVPVEPARPRSPQALPTPVRYKTSSAEFVSQEQALLAEEASGLNVPLVTSPVPRTAQPAALFGNTDDLVRAVILQEVLGPPLSSRASPPNLPPV